MTELYSILTNCDDSIFKLNSVIAKKGFEIIKIDVPDLERNFKFLFNLPDKYNWTGTIGFPNGIVTDTFFNAFSSAEFIENWEREYVIVIKSNIGHFEVQENDLLGFERFKYIETFTRNLIDCLRLLKEGDIEVGCYFIFDSLTNDSSLYSLRRSLFTNNILKLNEEDVKNFMDNFIDLEIKNPLAKRMKLYFDQSYSINQLEIRYILLVTALESVLNSSKEQIAHTFSRHLSIIISKQKNEFKSNYNRFKNLYDFRSKIVHGSEYKKELLNQNCAELRDYVRKAIVYINQLELQDNKELFETLNEKGYE